MHAFPFTSKIVYTESVACLLLQRLCSFIVYFFAVFDTWLTFTWTLLHMKRNPQTRTCLSVLYPPRGYGNIAFGFYVKSIALKSLAVVLWGVPSAMNVWQMFHFKRMKRNFMFIHVSAFVDCFNIFFTLVTYRHQMTSCYHHNNSRLWFPPISQFSLIIDISVYVLTASCTL